MPNVRIKDQTTDTALTTGDYVIVDSETEGTRKYDLGALAARVEALEQSGGSGLTQTEKNLILTLFSKAAYAEDDASTAYDALESLWASTTRTITYNLSHVTSSNTATSAEGGSNYTTTLTAASNYTLNTVTVLMGGVDITSTSYSSGTVSIPSVTGNIVITATAVLAAQSITAVYTQSGTVYDTASLDSLKTDLVVTANYSGGTSETVPASNYTLSGTLTEGTSTVTVSYAGLTATFTVTVSHKAWSDGVPYSFEWIENTYIKNSSPGAAASYSGWNASPYLNCAGAGHLEIHNGYAKSTGYNAWYDENQTWISSFTVNGQTAAGVVQTIEVPANASYFRVSYDTAGTTGDRTYTITPTET